MKKSTSQKPRNCASGVSVSGPVTANNQYIEPRLRLLFMAKWGELLVLKRENTISVNYIEFETKERECTSFLQKGDHNASRVLQCLKVWFFEGQEAGNFALVAALLCHSSFGIRNRPKVHSGTAGA